MNFCQASESMLNAVKSFNPGYSDMAIIHVALHTIYQGFGIGEVKVPTKIFSIFQTGSSSQKFSDSMCRCGKFLISA